MGTKLTINLSDEQCMGLIRLAALRSSTVEGQLLYMIDMALNDPELLPEMSLDEFRSDLPSPV
jgi:hypothetical protein